MMQEVLKGVTAEDPIRGSCDLPKLKMGIMWCNASSVATGIISEIGDVMVEDAARFRKTDDCNHINMAELKGMSLSLKWGLCTIKI